MSDEAAHERRAKFRQLQRKLRETSTANRKDVIAEQTRQRESAQRKSTAHAFQRAKAERLLEERDLRERGEDVERHRSKTYTIEENEAWEQKLAEKERSRDKGMIDFQDLAERSYQRQLKRLTPDRAAYARQKEQESQEGASTAVATRAGSDALVPAREAGASPTVRAYGTHAPDDEAVDRLVHHLNHEYVLRTGIAHTAGRTRSSGAVGAVKTISTSKARTSTSATSASTGRSSAYVHPHASLTQYFGEHTQEFRENRTWHPLHSPPVERGTAL